MPTCEARRTLAFTLRTQLLSDMSCTHTQASCLYHGGCIDRADVRLAYMLCLFLPKEIGL